MAGRSDDSKRKGAKPAVYLGDAPAEFEWKGDKQAAIDHICGELSRGGWPLSIIRANMVPPIPKQTLTDWRAKNETWAKAIDDAFETGMDRMAVSWRLATYGVEGHTTGSVERDKLVAWTADKLLAKWDRRYRERMVHENDPDNPAPSPTFVLQPVKSLQEIEQKPGAPAKAASDSE
jgi:hypothetical protein